jgi:hypothetical protein
MRDTSGLEREHRRIVANGRSAAFFGVSAVEYQAESCAIMRMPWNSLVWCVVALGDIEAGRRDPS